MAILTSPLFTGLISGVLMFALGFVAGQLKAERRAKLYLRIRGG